VIHYGSQTVNRAALHRLEKRYEKKTLLFRKHGGSGSVWTSKVALFVCSLAEVSRWMLAWPRRHQVAAPEIVAHAHIVARAPFL
jgi:hypothetical protein